MEYTCRAVTDTDKAYIFGLKKAAFKAYVEAAWGWDEDAQWARFCGFWAPSTLQIIQVAGVDVGFLGVEQEEDVRRLANIVLEPAYQGRGIGSSLLCEMLTRAEEARMPVVLQVLKGNPARALYERLGFWVEGESETHDLMRWEAT